MPIRLRRIRVPGDGTCFFHSVSLQVDVPAKELRRICSNAIRARANELFQGLPLRTWIQYEYNNMTIEEYSRQIRSTLWGGPIEMKLLADHFGRPFVVYEMKVAGRGKQLLSVLPSRGLGDLRTPVYLLYCGNHFDALLPQE